MKTTNTVTIERAPNIVFSWISNPEKAMKWMESVVRYEIIYEAEEVVGTTFREYVGEEGKGLEMIGVITAYIQDELFSVHLESKVNIVEVSFVLANKSGSTNLIQSVDMKFRDKDTETNDELLALINAKIEQQAGREFAKLKMLCEMGE